MADVNQKKLLEGIGGKGIEVGIRSLAKFMACAGVLVTPHVGRMRGYVSLPGSVYGVKPEKMSESGSAFYNERVSQGHLNFIPRDDEAYLATLEKRLRRAVENYSVSDGFMPMKAYDNLKSDFEDIRTAYFDKKDEIISRWDTLLTDFENGASEMLQGMRLGKRMKEQVLKEFLAEVPSRIEYAQSFKMNLRVHAFPSELNEELAGLQSSLAADVLDTWKEDVVSTAILSIERQIGIGWEKMLSAMRQYIKDNAIKGSTINTLLKYADEMSWKNVFNNPAIADLSQALASLRSATVVEDKAVIIEDALVALYDYAKAARLELSWKGSPYSKQTLEDMLTVRKSTVMAIVA